MDLKPSGLGPVRLLKRWQRAFWGAFLKPTPQEGVLEGQYYRRSGSCNSCARCCQEIYLVYGGEVVAQPEAFEQLKKLEPQYQAFVIQETTEYGLLFACSNLLPDNSCGIYEDRPQFCRDYPSETNLLQGGTLPADCSYTFEVRKPFHQVLQQHQATGLVG